MSSIIIHPAALAPLQPPSESDTAAINSQSTIPRSDRHLPESNRGPAVYISDVEPGTEGQARTSTQPYTEENNQERPGLHPLDKQESSPFDMEKQVESPSKRNGGPNSLELTEEEKRELQELKARDAEVRRHEQAHVMAGGRYITSRAQFEYVVGPDGKLYAVGGEVQIDTSEVPDDPEATIEKAQTVRRAALAPSDPSAQDQRIAAEATRMEFEARMELSRQRTEEAQEQTEEYDQQGQASTTQPEPILISLFA